MATGLVVNYLIILLNQSLRLSLLVGFIVCVCGFVLLFMRWKKEIVFERHRDWCPIVAIAVILTLYYFTILYDPLNDWDARSIWFFHSKMIWSSGSLSMASGWDHPSLQFSHVDYPKLIPTLAAQLSYVLGYWNEYVPKYSLFLLLVPAIFWIFSFYSRRISFLFLVLVFPFGLKSHLWSGSMDGYIALYSAISMLLFGRYFKHHHSLDLISGISCLVLVSNIKNEGILIGLVGMLSLIATGGLLRKFKTVELRKIFTLYRVGWLAVILSPGILWSVYYKNKWGLFNDLQIGTTESIIRIMNRFSDGVSFPLILKKTIFHDESAMCLSIVLFIVSLILLRFSKRHNVSWIPALITATAYYCGLVIIYLLTPNDLSWHLATSAQRTILTVSSCVLAGAYFVLNELEDVAIEWRCKKRIIFNNQGAN